MLVNRDNVLRPVLDFGSQRQQLRKIGGALLLNVTHLAELSGGADIFRKQLAQSLCEVAFAWKRDVVFFSFERFIETRLVLIKHRPTPRHLVHEFEEQNRIHPLQTLLHLFTGYYAPVILAQRLVDLPTQLFEQNDGIDPDSAE